MDTIFEIELDWDFMNSLADMSKDRSQFFTFSILAVFYCIFLCLISVYFIKLLRINPYVWRMGTKLKIFVGVVTSVSMVSFVLSLATVNVALKIALIIVTCLLSSGILYFLRKVYEEVS